MSVTNPAPELPTGVSVTPGFQIISLYYDQPDDIDWLGVMVWLSTSSGFTRNETTLKYKGPSNRVVIEGLTSGETYYMRFALYDAFIPPSQKDATNLNESSEYTFTTDVAITASEVSGLSNWATRLTAADQTFIDANIGSDAITSTRIASIVAGKIAAGTLASRVAVSGVFVATGTEAVFNETGLTAGTWRLDLGPISDNGTIYIQRYYNGYASTDGSYACTYSLDESGNAVFGGDVNIANVVKIDSSSKSIWINDGTYGNDGIQLEYNSGTPRFHVGDKNGGNNYLEYDGSSLTLKGSINAGSSDNTSITTGLLQSADGNFIIDLTNKYIYIA